MSNTHLSAQLARFMDLKAFDAKRVGKEQAERLKARREIANKRAKAAIRFFLKQDNFERLERAFSRKMIESNEGECATCLASIETRVGPCDECGHIDEADSDDGE